MGGSDLALMLPAPLTPVMIAIIGYLLGSLPFAVIVSRAFGLADPRSYGSGNPGATNVLRSGNKLAAILTLLGDAAKGWLAIFLAKQLGFELSLQALAGVAAFLGHVFPIFLRFKGGKGVATALGVLIGLSGYLAAAAGGAWLLMAVLTRYSSLAALVAACVAAGAAFVFLSDATAAACVLFMSALLIWRHQSNIKNLLAGTEGRLGAKKS